jgi:hypothetical protein
MSRKLSDFLRAPCSQQSRFGLRSSRTSRPAPRVRAPPALVVRPSPLRVAVWADIRNAATPPAPFAPRAPSTCVPFSAFCAAPVISAASLVDMPPLEARPVSPVPQALARDVIDLTDDTSAHTRFTVDLTDDANLARPRPWRRATMAEVTAQAFQPAEARRRARVLEREAWIALHIMHEDDEGTESDSDMGPRDASADAGLARALFASRLDVQDAERQARQARRVCLKAGCPGCLASRLDVQEGPPC